MVNVQIDEMTPCLKDVKTGDVLETEVIQISRKSFLAKFHKRNGWYVNWSSLVGENEVFALVVKGTVDIQGLIALHGVKEYGAVYVTWMCVAPHNNVALTGKKRYLGVGGHLFAIAVERSMQMGFEGALTGNAANMEIVKHYCEEFGAIHLGLIHPFQFYISEENAQHIKEAYDYEWTEDRL